MRACAAVSLLGFGFLALAQAGDDAGLKKEIEAVTGKWNVIKVETGGGGKNESVEGSYLHFEKDGKTLVFHRGGKTTKVAFTLNPAKNPKEITITPHGKDKSAFGIYKIEKNVMTICHARQDGGERPKEFATTKDERFVLITMERAK